MVGCSLNVTIRAYTGLMLQCIRCHIALAGFDQVEPNVDGFGLHFMCPRCGRRNDLHVVGRDEYGALIDQFPLPGGSHQDTPGPAGSAA